MTQVCVVYTTAVIMDPNLEENHGFHLILEGQDLGLSPQILYQAYLLLGIAGPVITEEGQDQEVTLEDQGLVVGPGEIQNHKVSGVDGQDPGVVEGNQGLELLGDLDLLVDHAKCQVVLVAPKEDQDLIVEVEVHQNQSILCASLGRLLDITSGPGLIGMILQDPKLRVGAPRALQKLMIQV